MIIRNIYMSVFFRVYNLVMGRHPNNTIFAFNFVNVRHLNRFLRACRKNINGSHVVVDIGAGGSPYHSIFSDIASRYIAIDAPGSLPKYKKRQIEYIAGFAEDLPLKDLSADIVLCNQVLEHVKDPSGAVNEILRILKPGGLFIGSAPHVCPVHLEPYDYRRFTDLGVEQLLADAGFKDIVVEGSGGVHSTAALMLAMDWMLSPIEEGEPQKFSMQRALFLAPLVGIMNATAIALDFLFGNKHRTPANLCWVAVKKG
ncbi:MAG: methyltransferase domain-containing protein [Sedimentisphaerales bacterium]|nr:methyltransferase domain-containing protein [Sedimentisphaerales bacterium]